MSRKAVLLSAERTSLVGSRTIRADGISLSSNRGALVKIIAIKINSKAIYCIQCFYHIKACSLACISKNPSQLIQKKLVNKALFLLHIHHCVSRNLLGGFVDSHL